MTHFLETNTQFPMNVLFFDKSFMIIKYFSENMIGNKEEIFLWIYLLQAFNSKIFEQAG